MTKNAAKAPSKEEVGTSFDAWEMRAIPALKAADILLNEVWFSAALEHLLKTPLSKCNRNQTCHVIERILDKAAGKELLNEEQHYGFKCAQEAVLAFEAAYHCGLKEGFSKKEKELAQRNRDVCEGHVDKAIGLAVSGVRAIGSNSDRQRLSMVIGLTKDPEQ